MLAFLLLMLGYECTRNAATSLFITDYGSKNLTFALMALPFVIGFFLFIYNLLLTNFGPKRTLIYTSSAIALILSLLSLLVENKTPHATLVLYLVSEVYIMIILEQYWSFIDSTYLADESKSWNSIIAGAGSLGAMLGGFFVSNWTKQIGTNWMPLIASILLLPGLAFALRAFSHAPQKRLEVASLEPDYRIGLRGIFSERTLMVVLCLVLCTQLISALSGLGLQAGIEQSFSQVDERTAFSGKVHSYLSGISLFLQIIVCPLVLKNFSLISIQIAIPLINLSVIGATILFRNSYSASIAYITFKSLDYSFFRATKEILFIPLASDLRYRTKALIDVFGYRSGKAVASLIIILLTQVLNFERMKIYSYLALSAALAWICLSLFLKRSTGPASKTKAD